RPIVPGYNNWLLFSATVEAGLKNLGAGWDRLRVDYALRQHEQWYKGDGAYGDGPDFHWDYYNSFVIHPLLLAVVDACKDEATAWKELALPITRRANIGDANGCQGALHVPHVQPRRCALHGVGRRRDGRAADAAARFRGRHAHGRRLRDRHERARAPRARLVAR